MSGNKLRCPCSHKKSQNMAFLKEDTVEVHFDRYGFVENYDICYHHREIYVQYFYSGIKYVDEMIHNQSSCKG